MDIDEALRKAGIDVPEFSRKLSTLLTMSAFVTAHCADPNCSWTYTCPLADTPRGSAHLTFDHIVNEHGGLAGLIALVNALP